MSMPDYITAAYLVSALLIGGLCLSTLLRAQRVRRALARQTDTTQP